jgi:hypothetical protein
MEYTVDMPLTKEQIAFIEDYLIRNKVKYWDIRMELLDHIASDIQEKMNGGQSFENALEEVHEAFGNKLKSKKLSKDQKSWIFNESIYADNSGYKRLIGEKHRKLTSVLRVELWKNIKLFFKNPVTLALYFGFILIFLELPIFEDDKIFARIVLIPLLALSVIPFIWAYFRFRKSFKSLYLSSLSMFPLLVMGLFNLLMQVPRIFLGTQAEVFSFGYTMFLYCVLFPLIYAGVKTFYNRLSSYHTIYRRLLK